MDYKEYSYRLDVLLQNGYDAEFDAKYALLKERGMTLEDELKRIAGENVG
jgi:hypothetical protein